MKIISFLCAALGLVCHLMAADDRGLEMTVVMSGGEYQADFTRDDFANGYGHRRYDFMVTLKNIGLQPLAILKGTGRNSVDLHSPGSLGKITENGKIRYSVLFAWGLQDFDIPSESELGLVKLQSGETARIHVAVRTDDNMDPKQVTFVYAVDGKLAARFGTWSGRLEPGVLSPGELLRLKEKQERENADGKK